VSLTALSVVSMKITKLFPPTYAEFHSLGWGIMDGVGHKSAPNDMVERVSGLTPDVRNEPHYYRLGYFLGNRLKWVGVTLFGAGVL